MSNVVPYTAEMISEILYEDSLALAPLPTLWHDALRVPPMDVTDLSRRPLRSLLHGYLGSALTESDRSSVTRRCPFIEAGSTSVSWQGDVSPCQPLVHTHEEFFLKRSRDIRRHVVGSVNGQNLTGIWLDPDYVAFRRRVQEFDFAPCIACGGCGMSDGNEEDCEGDDFPRCGACLWSHGLIRCP